MVWAINNDYITEKDFSQIKSLKMAESYFTTK